MEEVEYLCVWAWKKRGGWAGGRVFGSFTSALTRQKQWEYRSVVIVGHTLSYYEMGTEDSETPRGTIDLWNDQATFHIGVPEKGDGSPTPHQIVINATKVEREEPVVDASSNGAVDAVGSGAATTTTDVEWKLCFDQQEDLMRIVSVLNRILDKGGAFKQKDVDRFEHDFVSGDHIYRWEMIIVPPVIYPIQIHAIVLDAGRNILVLADFGLTGYAKKKDSDFHHAEDNDEAMQEQILAAFRKLRPTDSTMRLNISTLTDQREIRKWFKAGYDEESMLAKAKAAGGHHHIPLDKIGKNVGKIFKKRSRLNSQDSNGSRLLKSRDSDVGSPSSEFKLYRTDEEIENETKQATANGDDQEIPPFVPLEESGGMSSSEGNDINADIEKNTSIHRTSSSEAVGNGSGSNDAGVGVDDETAEAEKAAKQTAKQLQTLPTSDPVEIVLARANFCLENMDLLPPYHVFFSNSECIAVWCKTGRWSTLQTAVWCSTNSVGAFKTSTLTTIGVAAANPLLAPVIAIGGLLWVSAPMLILQKSRAAWEEYTQYMTGLFWDSAPNKVFVSAVENWTTVLKLEAEKDVSVTSPVNRKALFATSDSFSLTSPSSSGALDTKQSSDREDLDDEKKAEVDATPIESTTEESPKPEETSAGVTKEESSPTDVDAIDSSVSQKEDPSKTPSLDSQMKSISIDDGIGTSSNGDETCDVDSVKNTNADRPDSNGDVENKATDINDKHSNDDHSNDNINDSNDMPSKPKTFRILNASSTGLAVVPPSELDDVALEDEEETSKTTTTAAAAAAAATSFK
mmetsp:Transcript_53103/g.128921  ORF Transcript_53103/g.128921 Transcript_53103/m.128921 type:complete len:798 (+) Transcript_53103:182-2575(+)